MHEIFEIIPPSTGNNWLLVPLIFLFIAGAGFITFLLYSSGHTTVELSDHQLSIKGALYSRTVPLDAMDLAGAKIVDLRKEKLLRPKMRTNGISSIGYQSGWFRLNNGRKALLHVSREDKVLYLPSPGAFDLLLSVDNPERLMDLIKASEPS